MNLVKMISKHIIYSGSNWNFEKSYRYLFMLDNEKVVEASYFEHYYDGNFVKKVIELPITLGCNVGCKFCASSLIKVFVKLKFEEIEEIYKCIIQNQKLHNEKHLITFTGIGEMNNNLEPIKKFIEKYNDKKCEYTLSTINFNRNIYNFIINIRDIAKLRRFQITFISADKNVVADLIPFFNITEYDMKEIIELINKLDEVSVRINYVMIKNVNDSLSDMNEFISNFNKIKGRIRVRISKLNITAGTQKHKLQVPDLQRLDEFGALLRQNGFVSYVFYSECNDNLNCGQLVYNNELNKYDEIEERCNHEYI